MITAYLYSRKTRLPVFDNRLLDSKCFCYTVILRRQLAKKRSFAQISFVESGLTLKKVKQASTRGIKTFRMSDIGPSACGFIIFFFSESQPLHPIYKYCIYWRNPIFFFIFFRSSFQGVYFFLFQFLDLVVILRKIHLPSLGILNSLNFLSRCKLQLQLDEVIRMLRWDDRIPLYSVIYKYVI